MIVTVATFKETGEELEEGIRHVIEEVVPSIRSSAGLQAGFWVVDREGGQRLSIMVWDDAEAMTAAMPAVMSSVRELREQAGRTKPQRSPDVSLGMCGRSAVGLQRGPGAGTGSSRSTRYRILPTALMGSSFRSSICRGTLYGASSDSQ